ncbi:MAG: YtxH domain-containing protein [Candidatus Korobacteraceae bacterium]
MADRDGSGFVWFLAGLGIGAAVGILYAPKAGEETRQRIRATPNTVKERARQAGEYLNQQKEQIRSAYEAGRKAYREATSEHVEGATSKPNVP